MAIAGAHQELEAVYQGGVFRPLTKPALTDGARVHLLVEMAPPSNDPLELAAEVYAGLTSQDIADVEAVVLDRSTFFGDRASS